MAIVVNNGNEVSKTEIKQIESDYEYSVYEILVSIGFLIGFILVDASKRNRNKIIFKELRKFFDYEPDKIFDDLHDYESVSEYLYENINRHNYFKNKFSFFTLNSLVFNTQEVPNNILKNAILEGKVPENQEYIDSISWHFADIFKKYLNLVQKFKFEPKITEEPKFNIDYDFEIESKEFNYKNADILESAPESISLVFKFKKNQTELFEKELIKILNEDDDFKPSEKEILEFYEYLSDLKFLNSVVKIPISAIGKFPNLPIYLKLLEINKKLIVRDWLGNETSWEVELIHPETLSLFIPSAYIQPEKPKSNKMIKLSLDEQDEVLQINDKKILVNKSEHQFDLLKSLLNEIPIDFDLDFGEISENIETQYKSMTKDKQNKLKKRYSNACYQLNRKIELDTGIRNILKVKGSLVRFNSDYKFEIT